MITITEVRTLICCNYHILSQRITLHLYLLLSFPLSSLYQTTMVQVHLPTRKSTSLQTAPLLSPPRPPPTRQIQRWVSCRLSPLRWPQVQTPVPTCTRSPPTPPSHRTLPRTASERTAAAEEAKGATPSLTPAPCPHRHPPPRSTPRPPPSRLYSTAELPKRSPWRCARRTAWRWSSSCRRRKRKERAFRSRRTLPKEAWRKRRIETGCRCQRCPRRNCSRVEIRCL